MKDPDVVDFFNEYREVLISPYLEEIIWFMIYDFLIDGALFLKLYLQEERVSEISISNSSFGILISKKNKYSGL